MGIPAPAVHRGQALQYTINDQVVIENDYNPIKLELPKDKNYTRLTGYFANDSDSDFDVFRVCRLELKLFDVNGASPEHTYRTANVALLS